MKSSCSSVSFRHSTVSMLFVFILVVLISFTGTATAVYADTFTVTSLSDDTSNPVEGTLRYAIENATSQDIITFELEYPAIITVDEQLSIDHGLTIQGPGAELLAVSGNDACRVFYITASGSVDISGISIVNGCCGMYNYSSSPTVTNCTFSGNSAGEGGGMHNYYSDPTLTNCTFSSNNAVTRGGGMYNWESYPTLTNCTFSGNRSNWDGGGMYNSMNSSPTVTNCTFDSNICKSGGGMYNYRCGPTMTNCTFSGNSAGEGGGMYNWQSRPTLTNCTFSENISVYGGGMYNDDFSIPRVRYCTFSSNSATNGGGMFNNYSFPIVTNCIFWGDGGGIYNMNIISPPILSFCVVQSNDVGIGTDSNDITSADPELETLADNGGPNWTCALGVGSSALDAGTDDGAPVTDQRGISRPWGADYDIGAYERTSYLIDAFWSDGGSIAPASADIGFGDNVPFTVSPDSYYHINEIYVDGLPITFEPEGDGTFTYPFENVSADHLISADFALEEYSLSLIVTGSGSVTTSPDFSIYPLGTEVNLTATPHVSSRFSHWEEGLTGSINPETITITGPMSVKAVFKLKTFSITKDCGCHGDISGDDTVTWDATPTYDIDCCTGFAIDDVRLDGVSKGSVSSLTLEPVHANHTISVSFCFNPSMVSESGLEDFSLSDPNLRGNLLENLLLPSGITSGDLDRVTDDSLEDIYMQAITAGVVAPLIERREQGEVFVKGVSFDISYSQDGADWAILPLHVEMNISREDIGLEYASLIDEESADKGLRSAFLDHVEILKIISSDVYNLLEEAWGKYEEEEAKAFFDVDSDLDNYYVGMNLLVADATADTPEMAVQAISDGVDRYFFIFDGERDGHFKDPLVAVIQPIDDNDGGGGGGCSISVLSGIVLLLMLPLMFLSGKMK